MKIVGVKEVLTIKGITTIVTEDLMIELPEGDHTIKVLPIENPADEYVVVIEVDLYSH